MDGIQSFENVEISVPEVASELTECLLCLDMEPAVWVITVTIEIQAEGQMSTMQRGDNTGRGPNHDQAEGEQYKQRVKCHPAEGE